MHFKLSYVMSRILDQWRGSLPHGPLIAPHLALSHIAG
jgi:hypothetical protein